MQDNPRNGSRSDIDSGLQPGPLMSPASQPPAVPPPLARPRADRQGTAILMICGSTFIFAAQDGVSRHLGALYSPIFIVMLISCPSS